MPGRVPFETVRYQDGLLDSMVLSNPLEYLSSYLCMLKFCGWTLVEYEKELLKRIDAEWIAIHNKVYG